MTQTRFNCMKCDMKFNAQKELDDHMRSRHVDGRMERGGEGTMKAGSGEMGAGMGRQSDMGGSMTGTQTSTDTRTGTFRCEACGSEFRSRSEWEDHGRTAHNR